MTLVEPGGHTATNNSATDHTATDRSDFERPFASPETSPLSAGILDILGPAIAAARNELAELPPVLLAAALEEVTQATNMLDAARVDTVHTYDQSMEWSASGYRHPSAFLKAECRLTRGAAGKALHAGRSLETMPETGVAFDSGHIGLDHVAKISTANNLKWREQFAECEALLVENATTMRFDQFAKTVDYFIQRADEDAEPEPHSERRNAHHSTLWDGMGKVDALLDPVGSAAFGEALRRIEQELFDADWAEARACHGEAATLTHLRRSRQQRRADALVEMAHRSMIAPKDGKRPLPLVVVTMDHATFMAELQRQLSLPHEFPGDRVCELSNGVVIHPATAIALALEGHVRRLVIDAPSLKMDFGRGERFFTGALRLAIQLRDKHCDGPGCDIGANQCDIDHIEEFQDGGRTSDTNGKCQCPWHHKHKHRFNIHTEAVTGKVTWTQKPDPPPLE